MTPRCVIVVAVLTLLGGCNGVLHGRPTFDTDLLVLTNPPAAGIPPTCQTLLNQNPADQETDVARNNCVFPLMTMIDQAYYRYQTSLFGGVNTGNAATDILSLGLTSAATLAGGNAAKSILAAIATGVNGAKGKIDADILYNRSIELIITQMDADRADWKARILSQIKHDRNYNIYAAAPDLPVLLPGRHMGARRHGPASKDRNVADELPAERQKPAALQQRCSDTRLPAAIR